MLSYPRITNYDDMYCVVSRMLSVNLYLYSIAWKNFVCSAYSMYSAYSHVLYVL